MNQVCRYLEDSGKCTVTYVGVDSDGIVRVDSIKAALSLNTVRTHSPSLPLT
jgi:cysteine sulfinate desulfinase/cysteine desulfurase-like protein